MSFLDKVKKQVTDIIPKGFGDETVRVMDLEEEESPEREPKAPRPKIERAPKAPREPRGKKLTTFRKKEAVEEFDSIDDDSQEFEIPLGNSYEEEEYSAFDLNETIGKDFLRQQGAIFEKKMNDGVPIIEPHDGKISDVLEVLKISPTFQIAQDVFMPEDLKKIDFDLQAPTGYDIGQIDSFLERVKMSIGLYVKLLQTRNADVAKLATVVDKQQVIANNARYQSEIANGINIMPTVDTADLESMLMEAKLYARKLEDQLSTMTNGDGLSNSERQAFDDLQDELSVARRDKETLEEENQDLKNQIAEFEDRQDNLLVSMDAKELNDDFEEPVVNETKAMDTDLPDLFGEAEQRPKSIKASLPLTSHENSVFQIEESELADAVEKNKEFFGEVPSTIDILGDDDGFVEANEKTFEFSGNDLNSEETVDELDELMKNWNEERRG